ncbi:PREDICTED: Fanconi anemia core complex-associated protein 100 [Corvus brachyrhynchos]|uniref:Fanconi anemia core complex-associated protein 100 n=1 Tax=Corvus brachyrhynchos TaxID=85066 RepID=UPI00081634BB|nr:PREDICTED: Fanconi anemia core complex-associated protein 100 [Corvus brachyrhynchos]
MAQVGHRVDYLAGFCCPVGGLVAGKPRVLCHENEIYLSNGTEFVYVYDQEGKVLKAVFRCPDQVWHVELHPQPRQLYILCAHSGIYCVSLEQQSRLMEQTDGDGQESNGPSGVFPGEADACIFPDASLSMFTLLSTFVITWAGDSSDPEDTENGTGVLPPVLSPASLSICSVVALSLSSRASEGESELLALSAKGRLVSCGLCSPEEPDVELTPAEIGRRIKELLSGIGDTSERVSFLKKAVDQRNRALASLNQVMNVSAALLSSHEGHKPIACTVTANWSCLLLQDTVTISCLLENCSEYSLEEGWTLCVQLLASPCALEEESVDSATTFTFPIDQLLPGNKRELTLPLGPTADTKLDLPLTISCALYYSLRDILGSGSDSSEDLDDFLPDDSPLLSPDREGICLPLSQCTIDMLQCLRFGSSPPGPDAPPAPSDPVETFLKVSREQTEPEEGKTPGEENLPPSAASIRVSSELLKNALKTSETDVPLCCATLRWLLAENPGAEALSGTEVASARGMAPDGGHVQLLVREVTVDDVSPAGPIQAVEILMESPSLAHMSKTHHAIIRRIQVPPGGRGNPKVTPNPPEWSPGCSGGHFCGTMV